MNTETSITRRNADMEPTITLTLHELAETLEAHSRYALADHTFTARAGADYGYVEAWELPGNRYLVRWADNYVLTDDADDLAQWLDDPHLDGSIEGLIHRANVRGIESIPAAAPGDDGPFTVLITRQLYGPKEHTTQATGPNWKPLVFDSLRDAQDWAAAATDSPYVLAHGESGTPGLKIVSMP